MCTDFDIKLKAELKYFENGIIVKRKHKRKIKKMQKP